MKRLLTVLLSISTIFFFDTKKAESLNQYCYTGLNEFGAVNVEKKVFIHGVENELFVEFDNPQEALAEFSRICSEFVKEYSDEKIQVLTQKNIYDFYEMYIQKGNTNARKNVVNFKEESKAFELLFDVYENSEKNSRILEIVGKEQLSDEDELELAMLLPNYDSFVEVYFSSFRQNKGASRSFNLSNAVTYATTYAVWPNINDYHYYLTSDCTNFASQILEAGGYSQNYTGNQSSGWWHLTDGTNTSSNSWRMADWFCDYFGVSGKTTSHYLFSVNLSAGNFICYDKYRDGDWDHVGFVTQKDSTYSSTLGYYDYTVAQHTSNYILKTSSSINGWEELETSTYNYWYGIIVVN